MTVPLISFIMPTYNASAFLAQSLASIERLDYPKDKIEVLIADGGSTDGTLDIASRFDVVVLKNPHRIAEFGKKVAFDASNGEIVVFLDADNIIASADWMQKMLEPLSDPLVIGVESNYLIADDFNSLNQYANLLVIVDPLARAIASKPKIVSNRNGNVVKNYAKDSNPVSGANGFLWRRSILAKFGGSGQQLNEVETLDKIASVQSVQIANVPGIGIYHYYCTNLNDYFKKRVKIANKHLNRASQRKTWVGKRGNWKLLYSSIYLCSIVGPIIEALLNYSKTRNSAWFWHPIISVLTVGIYVFSYLNYSLHQLSKA